MKVIIVLGLCVVVAFAATQQKKLIGGPDSLPFWLKPGYTGPMPPFHLNKEAPKKKLIGGPDSLPFWLKPGYTGKQPPHHLDHLKKDAETTETSAFGAKLKGHLKRAHDWVKGKLGKKTETAAPAPVEEPTQESAFGAKLKAHATNAVNKVKSHVKKAHDWVKGKLAKKTETAAPAPVEEPAQEESAFGAKLKAHATNAVNKVKSHVKKAHDWVKGKLGKKTETAAPAPVEEPTQEESAFGAKLKAHATNAVNKVKSHVKKAHDWVKGKLGKKTETAAPAPVEEQTEEESAFVDDVKEHAATAVNKAKGHFDRAHKWIKSKLNKTPAPEATQ